MLVEREPLLKKCKEICNSRSPFAASLIIREMENARPVDTEEVVRCKDCRNYKSDIIVEGVGWCEELERGMCDDAYCSEGERSGA